MRKRKNKSGHTSFRNTLQAAVNDLAEQPSGWAALAQAIMADTALFSRLLPSIGISDAHISPSPIPPGEKMGLSFDQAFSENLAALQYSVMPPLPAADPASSLDGEILGDMIAARVAGALSGLTVEMDKKTVGRLLKPVMSKDLADDVRNRRWTS